MSSLLGWDEDEKLDQTALTASLSSKGNASSDWDAVLVGEAMNGQCNPPAAA